MNHFIRRLGRCCWNIIDTLQWFVVIQAISLQWFMQYLCKRTFTFRGPVDSDCFFPPTAFLAFLKMYSRLPSLFCNERNNYIVCLPAWIKKEVYYRKGSSCWLPFLEVQLQLEWVFVDHQLRTVDEIHMKMSCKENKNTLLPHFSICGTILLFHGRFCRLESTKFHSVWQREGRSWLYCHMCMWYDWFHFILCKQTKLLWQI